MYTRSDLKGSLHEQQGVLWHWSADLDVVHVPNVPGPRQDVFSGAMPAGHRCQVSLDDSESIAHGTGSPGTANMWYLTSDSHRTISLFPLFHSCRILLSNLSSPLLSQVYWASAGEGSRLIAAKCFIYVVHNMCNRSKSGHESARICS